MPSRKESSARPPVDGKPFARLAEVLKRGVDGSTISAREREIVRAAASALFPPVEKGVKEAFARRGWTVAPKSFVVAEGTPDSVTTFASLSFDLTGALGLDHPSWQGLEVGAYFGYDATGFRDRLAWGVSGFGDKEWVERSVAILRPKRRPDEPFLRTGEPMYAGGEYGWYVLWAWERTPEAVASSDERALGTEVRSRLENLVARLVRVRSTAGNPRRRG